FRRPRCETLRECGAKKRLGAVDENTGGLAAGVLDDAPARWIRRRRADSRKPERRRIGDQCMAAGMGEHDRIVRRGLVDEVVGLEALDHAPRSDVPLFLMPAASLDPGPR